MKGTAIVDAHHGATAILQIGNLDEAGEGEIFVRGGHGVHVKTLTAAGAPAMKTLAVPGGRTLFFMALGCLLYLVFLTLHDVALGR